MLDAGGTADTSVTVMDVLAETDERLARDGVALWVAGLPTQALAKARRTAAWATWVAAGKLHPSSAEAVEAFRAHDAAPGDRSGSPAPL